MICRWLGVEWDEGPDVGGPNGPYVQTQRMQLYRNALKTLIETDRVFPAYALVKIFSRLARHHTSIMNQPSIPGFVMVEAR